MLDDKPLKLTALEFNLLESLARARGRVRTREHLIETLGERMYDGLDRSIDVHIWSLRRKLGDDPKNPRFIRPCAPSATSSSCPAAAAKVRVREAQAIRA